MQILNSGFGQRRKESKRPRDLHIRKVSFSGSSLASACSLSSSVSTASTGTFGQRSTDSTIAMDPLSLHPTFSAAPPPLSERPFKSKPGSSKTRVQEWDGESISYFDDSSSDDEDAYDDDVAVDGFDMLTPGANGLPPHASPMDHADLDDGQEPGDYFLMHLSKRPQMPRSRWSESTVHTLDSFVSMSDVATPVHVVGIPNFSYKRVTVVKRPSVKGDSGPENFIKRGGWKRRGIVFQQDEASVNAEREQDYAFSP
jgi:hypothetical protein